MCINPDGEFIAPFDIEAVKLVTAARHSEVLPTHRLPSITGEWANEGQSLHYPCGGWVVSPGGPGIHCYHLKKGGPYLFYASDTIIRLTIPKGAKVFWETMKVPGQQDATILAASEVLVVS